MLTAEENEQLTRVGPETPMGELLRRYWMPIAPAAVLEEDPVRRVRILGEDLTLYRDRSGNLGLIGARCAHRTVDLAIGIPAEHGLRCPYHGWCYDGGGHCIETPFEPASSRLKDRIKIDGYPVQELGGLVFAYLGPEPAPLLPRWDFLVWPNSVRQVVVTKIPCNWVQCHENSADPFHAKFLHGDFFKYQLEKHGQHQRLIDEPDHQANLFAAGTVGADGMYFNRDTYGFTKGIKFSTAKGAPADTIQQFPYNIFPLYSRGGGGIRTFVNMRVPMDDTTTYHLMYMVYHAPGVEAPAQESVPYFEAPLVDEQGRPILDLVEEQDWAAWMAQGAVTDRTQEHLASTDLGVVAFRRLLAEQMEIVRDGGEPLNVFRDPDAMGSCIEIEPKIGSSVVSRGKHLGDDIRRATDRLHEGYYWDNIERFGGKGNEVVFELMRRAADSGR